MKKIAILTCLKACKVCSSIACFRAFNNKTDHFAAYGQDVQLVAFLHCNGCTTHIDQDMQNKLDKLVSEQVSVIHLGVCTSKKDPDNPNAARIKCSKITPMTEYLQACGIQVVYGTHG